MVLLNAKFYISLISYSSVMEKRSKWSLEGEGRYNTALEFEVLSTWFNNPHVHGLNIEYTEKD